TPIAGGESFCSPDEFEPFFEAGAYGVVQPDAAVVGGPASCVEVCRRARHFGVPISIHAWSAGVGLAQNLHAAWSAEGVTAIEWPQSSHEPATEPIRQIVDFRDGHLHPPSCPGLGVNVSRTLIGKFPFVPGSERDY
ncbi:MAG: enolase C-terminal domain-like protein, partial [Bryobacteraceae bacterium]